MVTYRQTVGWMDGPMDRQTNRWMDQWTDRPIEGWTNGWANGLTLFLFCRDAIDASENDDGPTDFAFLTKTLPTDQPTDGPTDERTYPIIEMR